MKKRDRSWGVALPTSIGVFAIVLMIGSLGAWSVRTEIAGAVVAPGIVEVQNKRQVIQHPDGGVVGEILARDGDVVSAGDILVRFEDTFLLNELSVVEGQLLEIFARMARLKAERDGAVTPDFGNPPDLATVSQELFREQVEGQARLFEARRISLDQNARQLKEQQVQIEQQIEGIEAQRIAFSRQLELIEDELEDVDALFSKGLVQSARLLQLKRTQASLIGEIGSFKARIAEARTRISALEIQRLNLFDKRREEAIATLRDLRVNEIELIEKRFGLLEHLSRLDVRAPVSGTVFGSNVLAVQSVVRAADPMMYVVPGDQPLQVSARISPTDIEQVFAGQDVALMFTTFNRRTTPEVSGKVLRVSADVASDEMTGEMFYEAVVVPDEVALSQLENVLLLPGMPAEAFLSTENRTPLNYLTRPLTVYFDRAFREQ